MTPFVSAGLMICNSLSAIVLGEAATIKHFLLWQQKIGFLALVFPPGKTATVKCSFNRGSLPWLSQNSEPLRLTLTT
jgi:hypothetical protein